MAETSGAAERASRFSLLSTLPVRSRSPDADLEELRRTLIRRLLAQSPTSEAAHLLLAAVVGLLFWGELPLSLLLTWLGVVAAAALSRMYARFQMLRTTPTARSIRALRVTILLTGLAWAIGPFLIADQVSFEKFALVMVVFSGLAAGATATLLADPKSFAGFIGATLVPLIFATLLNGTSRTHIVAVVLIVLFLVTTVVIYLPSHRRLLQLLSQSRDLEESEAKAARDAGYLDALLASAPLAIVTLEEGRVSGVNPAFETMFGYTAAELVGRPLNETIVPPHARAHAIRLDEQVAAGETVVVETERQRKDGTVFPVRAFAAVAKGAASGAVFVLYDDLSALAEAEVARRRAEGQYKQLVESASDLVWQIDLGGRWRFLNPASRTIYGSDPDVLLGTRFVDRVHPEHVEADESAFRTVFDGAELTDYETVHRAFDGTPKHLSFSARALRDGSDVVVGAHGTARDVSDRADARSALEEARAAAERAAAAKAAFLANMSHEIRTPMNGILGMTELLFDTELTPEQGRHLALVRESAEALLVVINDILDISKYESQPFELEHIEFDLPGLASAVCRLLGIRAGQGGTELVCDIDSAVPARVVGDPGRLRQILNNLIGNAIKFTERGEVVVSLTVEERNEDQVTIRARVRDTGIGIPADRLDAIFDEFSQADTSTTRRYGGTGLGLAISRLLVQKMGGALEVQSEPGVGSEFSFALTLPVPAEDGGAPTSSRDVSVLAGARILVVDDNDTNRRVLSGMLREAGAVVTGVESVDDALAALIRAREEDQPYAVGLVDVYMPDRDGFDLIEAVRRTPEVADTKVMLLTSGGQQGDGRRCRELGVDAYLTKPLFRADLLEAVAVVLGSRDANRQADLVTRHSLAETRRRVRVLLAEDNPVNQQVASTMLRKRGHDVHIAPDGQRAVESASTGLFEVILMDVQMPHLDGLAATRQIRKLPGYAKTPIVALTAHALAEERERCLAAGMDAHLAKPFKPHQLFDAVERWGRGSTVVPSGQTVANSEQPVDLNGFRAALREAGVEDALGTMLDTFLGDAPSRMVAIEGAVAAGDGRGVEAAAHAFKSAAATIGAHDLAGLLKDLEWSGREGASDRWPDLLDRVRVASCSAIAFLEREVRTETEWRDNEDSTRAKEVP